MRSVDQRDRQGPYRRRRVLLQGRCPLCPMLLVLPACLVRFDVAPSGLIERHGLGVLSLGCGKLPMFGVDRINAIGDKLTSRPRPLAGFLQAERVDAAQAHLPSPAIHLVSEDPRLRAGRPDLQP